MERGERPERSGGAGDEGAHDGAVVEFQFLQFILLFTFTAFITGGQPKWNPLFSPCSHNI